VVAENFTEMFREAMEQHASVVIDMLVHNQTPIGETAQISPSTELALAITSPTPCSLHIPLGIHERTEEVAMALAIPTKGTFHGRPIPTSYALYRSLPWIPNIKKSRLISQQMKG